MEHILRSMNGEEDKTMITGLKRLDELKKGKFIIVTDHGNINSYFDIGLPIFCMVPNNYVIYGFIQEV